MPHQRQHWDIFCNIIDNLGDIGVCWRLAKQLSSDHGLTVRLWLNNPKAAQRLLPQLDPHQDKQLLQGITIRHWRPDFTLDRLADVVIEAFACALPDAYLHAMAKQAPDKQPVWVNLEYLSAEAWIESCHLQPSPHPQLALKKTFYFPGWTLASGGLLRENGLLTARDHYLYNQPAHQPAAVKVSLFCYPWAPITQLLDAMTRSSVPIHCHVPQSSISQTVKTWLAEADLPGTGQSRQRGQLTVETLPFLSQDAYDRLLWSCDLNFVRGEDSWVRALWAGKPFIWQPYRQAEDTHLIKLEAFLTRYMPIQDQASHRTLQQFHRAWAGNRLEQQHWQALLEQLPTITQFTHKRCSDFARLPDLATGLVAYCKNFF